LNRALAAGGLGRIIAGLDDDMTPAPDWIGQVLACCERHPDVDIFGGHVYVIWPPGPVPVWARECRSDVLVWAFSAYGKSPVASGETYLRRDRWPCGNHFWFRSKLLTPTCRFGHLWVPEPGLFLNYMEAGSKALICNAVKAGHRLQPELLLTSTLYRRARMIGENFATDAMLPFRPSLKVPRAFSQRPWAARLYCVYMLGRYWGLLAASHLFSARGLWTERRIHAIERITFFRTLLALSGRDPAYRLFRVKGR
jgi:hypothetical protein